MTVRKICLGIALLLAAGAALAQPEVEWERTYGGDSSDFGHTVIQTYRGYLFAGSTYSFGNGANDVWLVCTDSDGEVLWTKTYGDSIYNSSWACIQTEDGGFVSGGGSYSADLPAKAGLMVCADAEGDSLWARIFDENCYVCTAIVECHDGDLVLAGSTENSHSGQGDFWLSRTDAVGNLRWTQLFDVRYADYCNAMIQTADRGFIMVGSSDSPENHRKDGWVVRTDENGEMLWSQRYGGSSEDIFYSVIETESGDFMLAGKTQSFGVTREDFWVIQIDADGEMLWSKTFGGGGNEGCNSITKAESGGFALAGYTHTYRYRGADLDCWMLRISEEGDSLWSVITGGVADDEAYSIIQTEEGGFLMGGMTLSTLNGNSDFYLVKTTPDPVSVGSSDPVYPSSFILYPSFPNPFNSTVTIPFGLDKSAPTRVAIFDPLGRKVAELIPSAGLVNGPYAGGKNEGLVNGPYVGRKGLVNGHYVGGKGLVNGPYVGGKGLVNGLYAGGKGLVNGHYVGGKGLVNGPYAAGRHSVVWNANGVPAGSYLVRLESDGQFSSETIHLVK